MTDAEVQLTLIEFKSLTHKYQGLAINLVQPGNFITPNILRELSLPIDLDLGQGIILYGKAPIWLYAYLIDCCYIAPWIACYNLRDGAVVVASRVSQILVGDKLPLVLQPKSCLTILIGGPPDSGKSVLSYALHRSLCQYYSHLQVYLHRANWDGEGNWKFESAGSKYIDSLVESNTYRIHQLPNAEDLLPQYFLYHADAIANIQKVVDLVIVDVGGRSHGVKLPVVKSCSHYLVISKSPAEVASWHDLCGSHLENIGVIHSVLDEMCDVVVEGDYFEMVAGPWLTGKTNSVPEVLLERIDQVLTYRRKLPRG
jgi:CRISPR-associated protein Csx3